MEKKPNVLIIADEDFACGYEKGYYKKIKEDVDNGRTEIISIEDKDRWKEIIPSPDYFPDSNELGNIYVRSPYTSAYYPLLNPGTENELITAQTFVVREALVKMGAKHIVISKGTKTQENSENKLNTVAGMPGAKGEAGFGKGKRHLTDIKEKIESHDENRSTKSYEEIWSYIRDHGLSSDVNLMNFLERIRTDGKISGTEKYMLTCLKEMDSAFSIAVSGNYKLFTGTVDYSSHKNTTYSFSYALDIDFG